MKKIAIALAFVMALASANVNARNTADAPGKPSTEKVMKEKKESRRDAAFEALNLSDKQKADLKKVREKYADSRKEMKKERKEARKNEKARKDADRKAYRERDEKMRKSYLADVKKILTPEQYMQLMESSFLSKEGRGGKERKEGKFARHDRDGKKFDGKKDRKRGGKDFCDKKRGGKRDKKRDESAPRPGTK